MATNSYLGGSLNKHSEIRTYPQLETSRIRPRSIRLAQPSVLVCTEPDISPAAFNSIISYWVARFYQIEGHHDNTQNRLLASIAGLIANCSNYNAIRPWQSMKDAFKTAGIDLVIQDMD